MADFKELAQRYQKKQSATIADSIATGLSLADEVSVDLGLISDSGLSESLLGVASLGLPLFFIAFSEGGRVLMGRKTATAGMQDSAFRLAKTGVAMGAGAAVAGLGAGALPAVPVAMGLRALMDKYRSNALTGVRIERRIQRLRALREQGAERGTAWEALPQGEA